MSVTAEPALLNAEEMAAILRTSTSTLYRICRNNPDFPRVPFGRKPMFNARLVLDFVDDCARSGRQLVTRGEPQKRRRK